MHSVVARAARGLASAWLLATLAAPAWAEGAVTVEKDRFIDFYLALKEQVARMPGLRGDGVTLSRAYLLDKLRERFNKEGVEVRDLKLTPEKGVIELITTKGPVDARHTIDFTFLPVDWAQRTIRLRFQQHSAPLNDTLQGQVLGAIAIGAFESATGRNGVKQLTDKHPYLSVDGDVLSVRMDQVPSLMPYLNTQIMGYKPFDFVGVKRVSTEQDQLRIVLALQKK